jgi:predicted 2-oxoglutarate/Fe(II)-dependent dioxygenase YbiX
MDTFDLRKYAYTFNDVLSPDYCETIVKHLETVKWNKHTYHNPITDTRKSYDDDLYTAYLEKTDQINIDLMETIYKVLHTYYNTLNFSWFNSWSGYSQVRFNKYSENTNMKKHHDAIKTLFEGTVRGDPTLSILGALNDDYEGGDLIFWNDTKIELKAGSVMVFPSTFLYPHSVETITKGTRYSFVSWVY